MAFVSTSHHAPQRAREASGATGFATAMQALAERISRYRMYRRTLAELSSLSGRELADLGFSQHSLRAAAYQAVYGAED